ncbi:MAG: Gfo/Idh/MocA family oxidoreductase [Acholeplasmatales bacterium]|nr:Gfo/Idh/MocA family oxidoreductase [Acholeplasmatales bacterium]
MRVAIIGMGNMGIKYARLISTDKSIGMELTAVTRIKESKKEQILEYLDNVKIYNGDEELFKGLDNKEFECDAIIVGTPHYSHKKIVIEAFERGLDVLCEKPAGVFLRDGREMYEANKNNNLYGFIFHHRTFEINKYLHDILKKEKYGKVKRVNYIVTDWFRTNKYYQADKWRSTYKTDGGGTLLNQCPHSLDLLIYLVGMPSSVMAFCNEGKYHNIEVEDEVTAYLEWDNGTTGVFIASTGETPGINRMEITTSKALITLYKDHIDIRCNEYDDKYYIDNDVEIKYSDERIDFNYDSSQLEVLKVFGRHDVVCDGFHALDSLYLSNAMYLSSWKKKIINFYPIGSKEEKDFEIEFEEEFNKKL